MSERIKTIAPAISAACGIGPVGAFAFSIGGRKGLSRAGRANASADRQYRHGQHDTAAGGRG